MEKRENVPTFEHYYGTYCNFLRQSRPLSLSRKRRRSVLQHRSIPGKKRKKIISLAIKEEQT